MTGQYLGKLFFGLTVLPNHGIIVFFPWGIIPIAGPVFQVSELLGNLPGHI
jgi:hypothetical protein